MNAANRSERALAAAMAHQRAGRLADAERLYRGVCEAEPENARAFHLLGVVAHQLRRSDAASLLGRAVALDPGLAEAHNDRGVILATSGLIPDALACFERAVALAPGYAEARNNLARGLRSLGRFDEAVAQLELILKSTPGSALAHFNLASVLEPAGQQSAAEKHYRSAIAMRPDFVDAHLHFARLLEKMDRLPEALAHAERAVTLQPDNAGACNNLGNILRSMGRRDDAIAQYEVRARDRPELLHGSLQLRRSVARRDQDRGGESAFRTRVRAQAGFSGSRVRLVYGRASGSLRAYSRHRRAARCLCQPAGEADR